MVFNPWLHQYCNFWTKGIIRGSVIDEEGQPLFSANVVIKGASNGTTTDFEGEFTLNAEPGSYEVQVSFIGYQTLNIENVKVKPGEVSLLQNVQLKPSTSELAEAEIQAEAIRTSEAASISIKKKSAFHNDGISSNQMQLVGDGTAIEASKRVTGVSIQDGKYIYVRGLGDRYTKTTLNGIPIPGLDPIKTAFKWIFSRLICWIISL
ncbi:MAG: carboxypeptidase-like regulatory domain-containing protein [Owenweeksia sp.]|nr:carboxypeptidase-like regulatory domain-containing protein [Owenweeksia sp.]